MKVEGAGPVELETKVEVFEVEVETEDAVDTELAEDDNTVLDEETIVEELLLADEVLATVDDDEIEELEER